MAICVSDKFKTRLKRIVLVIISLLLLVAITIAVLELFFVHNINGYRPDPATKTDLTDILKKDVFSHNDYDIIFSQTGLKQPAVDAIKAKEENFSDAILSYQDAYLAETQVQCNLWVGFVTRHDELTDAYGNTVLGPHFADLQPGDILVSFSTHTTGWMHGHAALVIDENTILESMVMGSKSTYSNVNFLRDYSNYIVLRVKDASEQTRKQVVEFAKEQLYDIPYHLLSGIVGYPDHNADIFGANCSYLVWYAYKQFGFDLDGGPYPVTPLDILKSDKTQIVQVSGVNKDFCDKYSPDK
ncbi:MAG: hypothetical protein IJF54_06960 [Clostridia bacterium]|nr:hypothetical protein [Clostridia bacterium]